MIMVQHLVAATAFVNQTANATTATTTTIPPPPSTPTPTNSICSPATPTTEQPHSPLTPISPKEEKANSPATPTSANTTPTLVQALSGNNWHKKQNHDDLNKKIIDKDTICAIKLKDAIPLSLSPNNIGSTLTPAPTPTTSPTSTSPVPTTITAIATSKLSNNVSNSIPPRPIDVNSPPLAMRPTILPKEEKLVDCVEEFAVLYSHLRQRKFQTSNNNNNNTTNNNNNNITTNTVNNNNNNLQLNLNLNGNNMDENELKTTQPQIRRSVITANSNNNLNKDDCNNAENNNDNNNDNVSSSQENAIIKTKWHSPRSPIRVYTSKDHKKEIHYSDDSTETPDVELLKAKCMTTTIASNYAQDHMQSKTSKQQKQAHITHTLSHNDDNNSFDVRMDSSTPTITKDKRSHILSNTSHAYASDEEDDEEEFPLDLSINASSVTARNNRERNFSGTESDDSGSGVATAVSDRRRHNAKHFKAEESSAAYKKSLMKRYCKFI